jgi:hypothetical protein
LLGYARAERSSAAEWREIGHPDGERRNQNGASLAGSAFGVAAIAVAGALRKMPRGTSTNSRVRLQAKVCLLFVSSLVCALSFNGNLILQNLILYRSVLIG